MSKLSPAAQRGTPFRRPYVVVSSLSDLHGPTTGVVTLPNRLDWAPTKDYDLASWSRARRMYQTVLREALSTEDIEDCLDAGLLRELWPDLGLADRIRLSWEERFPELAA